MSETPIPPPFVMTEDEYNVIVKALFDKRATHPCARCGNSQFELQPAYTTLPLTPNFRAPGSLGPYIPCAVVACQTCGALTLHSLAQLGIDPGTPPA